jgi:hypothetical protein
MDVFGHQLAEERRDYQAVDKKAKEYISLSVLHRCQSAPRFKGRECDSWK